MVRIACVGPHTRQSKTGAWDDRSRVDNLTYATDDPEWLTSETASRVASALPVSTAKWLGDPAVADLDSPPLCRQPRQRAIDCLRHRRPPRVP